MANIKSFVYLDYDKMYSLSSQLFEGLVEHFVESTTTEKGEEEKQSGPVGSGNILADVLISQNSRKEEKFLHDYLYTKFEEKLFELKIIQEFQSGTNPIYKPFSFIKVKGQMVINDSREITKTLEKFNKIGEALVYMQYSSEKGKLEEEVQKSISNIGDRNERSRKAKDFPKLVDSKLKEIAKEQNLYIEPELLEKLNYMLQFGYKDSLEIQIFKDGKSFSTILNREFLKETEDLLEYKLSKHSIGEITLIGIVTQGNTQKEESSEKEKDDESSQKSLKYHFRNMLEKLGKVNSTFSAKEPDEVIIDPIAIYMDI